MYITLKKCHDGKHKYIAVIETNDKKKTVKFGAIGYSDFTLHKNVERKKAYLARHSARENFDFSRGSREGGIFSKGWWSRYILWNKPTIDASIKATERKFGIKINH